MAEERVRTRVKAAPGGDRHAVHVKPHPQSIRKGTPHFPCPPSPFFLEHGGRAGAVHRGRGALPAAGRRKIRKPVVPATSELSNADLGTLDEVRIVKGQQRDEDRHRKADPPRKPAPMICCHPTSLGNCDTRHLTAKNVQSTIPNGLPSTKPTRMPRLFEVSKLSAQLPESTIPVFASANSGMMRKATGLCRKCCTLYDGDVSSPCVNGIAKASSTPASVAWTPDLSMQYHMTRPGIRYKDEPMHLQAV